MAEKIKLPVVTLRFPSRVLVEVMCAPLLIQLVKNGDGRAVEDGPRA